MIQNNNIPKVSVILPVYNGINYLEYSVASVLHQEFKDFELLIIDDCSTDRSWEYLLSLKDERVKLFRNQQNTGLFFNLNFLIQNTNSTLIKLWAQDDVMYPHCLGSFVQFHQLHRSIGFSYSGTVIIDEYGHVKKPGLVDNTPEIISSELHARIAFFTGSIAGNISNVCINKYALDKAGLFNAEMLISADFDMWVRLAKDFDTGFIADKLIQLRDHKEQLSRKEDLYINHIKEDLIVYRNLFSYVTPELKKTGKLMLRNHKFVFYYTLMIKAFIKGKLKTAHLFYKQLTSMDNFFKLSIAFLRAKIINPVKPDLLK